MAKNVDRHLLLAILAFQNNFIDRRALLAAFDDWSLDKSRSLGDVLISQKALSAEKLALVEALVGHYLEQHGGDVETSLAHASAFNTRIDVELKQIADPDVQASLIASQTKRREMPPSDPYATMPRTGDDEPESAARFKILRPHARGGLGEVFVAQDGEVPREVALKQIQLRHADDADSRARFIQEAEITGGLEHPNIVPVYGLGTYADGRPYYAMRFIRGDSFKEAIDRYHAQAASRGKRSRAFAFRQLLQRFIDVCNAVDYAHSRGVLHRDLKPANVMLGKYGETLVVDWGLAKVFKNTDGSRTAGVAETTTLFTEERPLGASSSSNATPTQMGTALGTPQFMSPEQAAGRLDMLGPASDVYSLGATLYYLLTARAPFDGQEGLGELLTQVQRGEFTPPRQLNRKIDKPLDAICRKAMALKPADRYASARALADDLEHWLADEPVTARKESAAGKIARWTRKNRTWTMAGFLALVTISVVSAGAAALIQTSKVNEVRALRTTAAADNFARGLQVEQWNDAHLQYMEGLIAELQTLEYAGIGELQDRLVSEYGQNIARRLRAATITSDDVSAVERQLAWLDSRKPAAAQELRDAFAQRLRVWQPVFELLPPFASTAEVFEPAAVTTTKDGITHLPVKPDSPYLATRHSAEGNVQLQAVFDPSWDHQSRVGLALRSPDGGGYEFVVVAAVDAEEGSSSGTTRVGKKLTFADARREKGLMLAEIHRNGRLLQSHHFSLTKIEAGPLRISAERVREQLVMHVNSEVRLEAFDPFALPGGQLAFSLLWPADTALMELRGLRQMEAAKPSPLEAADRRFDAAEYEAAMASYQEAAAQAETEDIRQEAVCKQAICLEKLNRPDEAIELFTGAAAEPGQHWPALAGIHLWFLLERQKRGSEADVAFEGLSSKYRFEQLAAIIPQELRDQLFADQKSQFADISNFATLSPARLKKMEQIAAIDRLLSPDSRGQPEVQRGLLRAYLFSDDLVRALPLAKLLHEETLDSTALRNYVRLLCWTGNPKQAVDAATRYLDDDSITGRNRLAEARLCRARALAASDRWDEAEKDVDEAHRLAGGDHNLGPQAAGLKGLMLERRGMSISAREYYRACFQRHRGYLKTALGDNTAAVVLLALGAWCGELTDEEAIGRLEKLIGGGGNPLANTLITNFNAESLGSSLRSMWLSVRGRRIAEEAYLLESATMSTRMRSLVLLTALEIVNQGAFGGRADAAQQEVVWSVGNKMYDAFFVRGDISAPQAMQFALGWKGTLNIFGWGGVAPTLPADVRAEMAYILASRAARRGAEADAIALWNEAIEHAQPDSPAAKLAADDLRLYQAKQSRVVLTNAGTPTAVRILAGGKVVKQIDCAATAEVELPTGAYDFAAVDASVVITPAKVNLRRAEHVEVSIDRRWTPTGEPPQLVGLVAQPAALPQVGSWQCDTVDPRNIVGAIAWSPDDKQLACATGGQVRVYDYDSWKLVRVFKSVPSGNVVAWSSTGILAFVDAVNGLRIVKLDGGIDRRWTAHKGAIRVLAWSRDGQTLASAGTDREIRLWNLDGSLRQTIAGGHSNEITSLSWSHDDKYLASAAKDRTARIWTADGAPGATLDGYTGEIDVAWHPSKHELASTGIDGTVRMTQVDGTQLPPLKIRPGTANGLAWNPDGRSLSLIFNTEVGVKQLDGTKDVVIKASSGAVNSAVWSRAGDRIATSCYNSSLRIWNRDGTPLPSLDYDGQVRSVAPSPDGAKVAVAKHSQLLLLTPAGETAPAFEPPNATLRDAAWSADGGLAAVGYTANLFVWNADGKLAARVSLGTNARRVVWSPDAKRIAYLTDGFDVGICNRDGGALVKHPPTSKPSGNSTDLAWSAAPASLSASHLSGVIRRWDDALKPRPDWIAPTGFSVQVCQPSPRGDQILLAGSRGAKFVAPDADLKVEFADSKSFASTVSTVVGAWSPDGALAALGCSDGVVKIVRTADRTVTHTLPGHFRTPTAVAWEAGGKSFYSSSLDGTVRKWNAEAGAVEWVAAPLPGTEVVVFSTGGEVLHATPDAEQHLVYLVERPDESWDAITPAEFRKRIGGAK